MALPKSFLKGLSLHNAAQAISRAVTVYMKVSHFQILCAPSSSLSHWIVRQYSTLHKRSMLMRQFEKIKSQHPNYILLFQVGDFYELYGDDACKSDSSQCSVLCQLTLIAYPPPSTLYPLLSDILMHVCQKNYVASIFYSIKTWTALLHMCTHAGTSVHTHTHTHAYAHIGTMPS